VIFRSYLILAIGVKVYVCGTEKIAADSIRPQLGKVVWCRGNHISACDVPIGVDDVVVEIFVVLNVLTIFSKTRVAACTNTFAAGAARASTGAALCFRNWFLTLLSCFEKRHVVERCIIVSVAFNLNWERVVSEHTREKG